MSARRRKWMWSRKVRCCQGVESLQLQLLLAVNQVPIICLQRRGRNLHLPFFGTICLCHRRSCVRSGYGLQASGIRVAVAGVPKIKAQSSYTLDRQIPHTFPQVPNPNSIRDHHRSPRKISLLKHHLRNRKHPSKGAATHLITKARPRCPENARGASVRAGSWGFRVVFLKGLNWCDCECESVQ